MVKLQVRLHSGRATFLAGEQVNGEVVARVNSPTKARRICVEVFGHAFNRWEGHDESEYDAEVQFINVILLLWKPADGDVGVIEPGNYCFPFSFVIPPNALPNHRTRYGRIDYWCKAKVDRRWRSDDEFLFPFVVANIVDLNAITSSLNPVRKCFEEALGCCSGNGTYFKVQRWTSKQYWDRQESRCFTRDLLSFKEAVMVAPQDRDRFERRILLPALQPSYGCQITVHNFYVQLYTLWTSPLLRRYNAAKKYASIEPER